MISPKKKKRFRPLLIFFLLTQDKMSPAATNTPVEVAELKKFPFFFFFLAYVSFKSKEFNLLLINAMRLI